MVFSEAETYFIRMAPVTWRFPMLNPENGVPQRGMEGEAEDVTVMVRKLGTRTSHNHLRLLEFPILQSVQRHGGYSCGATSNLL